MEFVKEWHQSIKKLKFVCQGGYIKSFLLLQRIVNHYFIIYQLKHISPDKIGPLYMNKQVRFIYLLLITFAFSMRTASAQATFGSEEELKAQAAKLFDEDEFEEAYPLYSQLTSIYPKDPNYNYRLGVCMLFASDDKEKPVAFLEFAANKPDVDKEALFYLARAYHLNYRFDDAIKEYMLYKNVASSSKAEKLMVDRQIEMCKNGKKLLRSLTDLVVIEKKEMSRNDFFRSYDLSDIGGKLLVKPDEDVFKTALDKKKKEKSIIYLATNNNQVFFSSYGDDPERGKDIYVIRKLPTGEWSKPQTLGYPVNTEYDEDFPFLHPNGKVLYFCSKGHNSMGGYDIYKTTLNEETNTWNKPVNLDFPINTPDDDVLYVTNADEKEAYFSSARASKSGKTAVYHINVERRPIDIAIIKGGVIKNRDDQALDVKITVKDMNDNVILGIFNSKASNGVYLINIPNGGKFLFTVEATGFETQSDVVDVPVQYVFRPMKQEISYELGTDKLIIKNLFDEVLDDASYLLALNFIKEKSKMEVNVSDVTTTNTSSAKDTSSTTVIAGNITKDNSTTSNTKLTNDDIVKIGYSDADDVAKEAKDLREQADVALVLANQKNELALNKSKEAEQLMNDAAKMDDNVKKQATIDEANAATKEAEDLNQETVAAFNLAKKIEFRAEAKDQEAELSLQYAKDLEAAVKSKNTDPVLFSKLEEQQKKLDVLAEQNNNPTLANSLKMDVDNKKREWEKAVQASADIKQEIADNEALIITTQADADKEKNAKVKQGLLDQVAGLKMDTEESKKDLALNEQKAIQLQKEYNGAMNETALVGKVYDQAKTVTNEKAAADVAMIDKAKLEEKVNTIKNTTTADNTIASNTKTADVAVKTNDNAVKDNTTKTTDVAVKTNDNTVVDNTIKTTDNTVADNTTKTTGNTSETKIDYAKKYSSDIAAAGNITNELERENKKADLYKEWSTSINEDLTSKKAEVKTEKDKTKKKELNTEIATLEKELKEKQKTTSTTLATVEKLKKQETIVADNTAKTTDNVIVDNAAENNTTTEASININKKFVNEIESTNSITNEADREKAKGESLLNWSSAIDADVAKKKQDMEASSDPEMKALLAVKIKQGKQLSIDKQKEAVISLAKANRLKNPDVTLNTTKTVDPTSSDTTTKKTDVAVKTTDNTVADNATKTSDNTLVDTTPKTTDVAVKTSDNTVVENSTKTTSDTSGNSEEKGFIYSSKNAIEQLKKADVLNKEAEDLASQSNALKSKASTENNAATKNAIYAEAKGLSKQAEDKQVEALAVIAQANKTEYDDNNNRLNQYSLATKENTSDDISIADILKDEAAVYFIMAQKSREDANYAASFYEKEKGLEDANKIELIALEKQMKASAIYLKYTSAVAVNSVNNTTKVVDNTSDNTNKTTDVAVKTSDAENNAPDNTTKTTDNTIADNTLKTTNTAVSEVFVKTSTPIYSASKPIPVNEKLPEGLIFKVQIGAFMKPIPQDLFKGISPITGETTPQGFIRYTAGLFTTYATADKVKEEIRALGYKDAFVVGFYNGKRIPMLEAMAMLGGAVPVSNTSVVADNTVKTNDNAVIGNTVKNANNAATNTTTSQTNINSAAAQNISSVSGLFYTVQVGVYSQPVSAGKLYNIQPLYTEKTANGNLRYTTGIYNNVTKAGEAKNMIVDLGIKDAFVSAYFNGKRISLPEAEKLLADGSAIFSTAPNMNALPTFNASSGNVVAPGTTTTPVNNPVSNTKPETTTIQPTETTTPVTTNTTPVNTNPHEPSVAATMNPIVSDQVKAAAEASNVMTIDSGIVFKVQIGAFAEEVPLEIANKFLLIAKKGVKNYKDANGLTIYTVGTFRTYEEASTAKTEVATEANITDAFIVAYKDGTKISVEEAKTLIGK